MGGLFFKKFLFFAGGGVWGGRMGTYLGAEVEDYRTGVAFIASVNVGGD